MVWEVWRRHIDLGPIADGNFYLLARLSRFTFRDLNEGGLTLQMIELYFQVVDKS